MSSGIALALAICIIAGLLLSGVVVVFSAKNTEAGSRDDEREDEAMSKVKEDPREMVSWVPQ